MFYLPRSVFSYIFMTERVYDSIYQKNAVRLFMEIAKEP